MENSLKNRKLKLNTLKALMDKTNDVEKKVIDNPIFSQCSSCKKKYPINEGNNNLYICPLCGQHFYMPSMERAENILDDGFEVIFPMSTRNNPLNFEGYIEKVMDVEQTVNIEEAVLVFRGTIEGFPLVLCVMDSRFFMGSMGTVVGEKITLAFEYAENNKLPIVIFSSSGGARMHEGMFSLMQMAKTSAAAKRHHNAGLLYISCLTNPTTGGVTASFASLGDIILAEPNALIAFAGPRVIEQTIKKTLPQGFQRAEFLLEKGFVDKIVHRKDMRKTLAFLLKIHEGRT